MSHPAPQRPAARPESAARIRPTAAAAVFGGVVGLAIGCAYLGGSMARAQTVRMQAERIQGATAAGFTEEALAAAAGGLDASALAIARRHDPYTVAGGAQRDRQVELLTARLDQLQTSGEDRAGLRRVSFGGADPMQPFVLGNALDASRDLECLTQAVYYEARGEGRDGMRAVAQVVLNRVRHPAFPKTVCGVVFQGAARRTGCQFSFTCDGSMRAQVSGAAWGRARDIASAALSGAVHGGVGSATHFHTTAVAPVWRHSLIRVGQVGDHLFYRFGGRSGARSAFTYTPRTSTAGSGERLVMAGLDPTVPVRQAGQAVAYSLVLAQERLAADSAPAEAVAAPTATTTEPKPAVPAPEPVPAPAAEAAPTV